MEGLTCWDRHDCSWEMLWIGYYRSDRDPVSILPVESKYMPHGGMEGVHRVVIGCTQPDGWKITSTDPNAECFRVQMVP